MQVAGPESDTAILFIHGWPDSHDTWSHQMEYFSKKFRVGAIDLPGVGESDSPPERNGYHIDNILPLISAAIKPLGAKKTHLVAHDWGAIISWVFASRPEYASQIASYTAVSGPHPALARENLFDPMGFINVEWMHPDQSGLDLGAYGLRMRPIDMQKFGILYLDKGVFDGKRLLSKEWIDLVYEPIIKSAASEARANYAKP